MAGPKRTKLELVQEANERGLTGTFKGVPYATLVKILNIFTENDKAKSAETKLKYSNVMNDIQKAKVRRKDKKVVEELNNHLKFRLRQRAVRNILKTHEMIVPLGHEYGADTVSFLDKLRVSRVETLHLNISKYQPLRGASYVDLPPIGSIRNTKV